MHSSKSEIVVGRHQMRSTCNGCTERFVGCHSKCRKYNDARQEHLDAGKSINMAVSAEKNYQDYTNKHIDIRMRKEKWWK